MKKEPWGIKKLLIILIIIFVIFVIFALIFKGVVGIFRKDKKEEKKPKEQAEKIDTEIYTYSDLENRIKLGATRYQNDNYQGTLESSETWILKYNNLKEAGYMPSKLIDPKDHDECDGYVKFIKTEAKITYIPYIKCGDNYQTSGYDASYLK